MMEEEEEATYYSVLNVARAASSDDVKKAYRALAAVFHPDKHTDPELKVHAEATFSQLQEAYEILSDPQKRTVYDVYGRQGLNAGLEVGDHLKSREELRREWEKFQQQQKRDREEARAGHRGTYICRIDAREITRFRQPRYPLIKSIIAHSTLYGPGLDDDSWYVQGSAQLRQAQTGVGSIIAGYKREFSVHDSLELSVATGMQTMLTLTSHRQLTTHDSAALAMTYNASDGVGLSFTANRQLLPTTSGTFGWSLGPTGSTGMSLSASHRIRKALLSGKLEIGMVHALSFRMSYLVGPKTTLRLALRLGTTGVDCEVAAAQRLTEQSSGAVAAVVGLQGVWLKAQYKYDGHTFEVPMWMSEEYRDWKVVLAAHLGPPLVGLALTRYVVRPVKAWRRQRQERAARRARLEGLRGLLAKAVGEQRLLEGPAARKAVAEAGRGGLVVLAAAYGVIGGEHEGEWAGRRVEEIRGEMRAVVAGGVEAGGGGEDLRSWVEVGVPVQYMVSDGRLEISRTVQKAGLMGFADVAPLAEKQLYVGYWRGGQVYEVFVGQEEDLRLPEQGLAVRDEVRWGWLRGEAEARGLSC